MPHIQVEGVFLENSYGNMIMERRSYYQRRPLEILHGLQWCANNGYYDTNVESDSLVIINMINIDSNVT